MFTQPVPTNKDPRLWSSWTWWLVVMPLFWRKLLPLSSG